MQTLLNGELKDGADISCEVRKAFGEVSIS